MNIMELEDAPIGAAAEPSQKIFAILVNCVCVHSMCI